MVDYEEVLTNCPALDIQIEPNNEYRVEIVYTKLTQMEELLEYAKKVLIFARAGTKPKEALLNKLYQAKDNAEYITAVDETDIVKIGVKCRLKETL